MLVFCIMLRACLLMAWRALFLACGEFATVMLLSVNDKYSKAKEYARFRHACQCFFTFLCLVLVSLGVTLRLAITPPFCDLLLEYGGKYSDGYNLRGMLYDSIYFVLKYNFCLFYGHGLS